MLINQISDQKYGGDKKIFLTKKMAKMKKKEDDNNGGIQVDRGLVQQWEVDKWNQRPKIGGQWKKYIFEDFNGEMKKKENNGGI